MYRFPFSFPAWTIPHRLQIESFAPSLSHAASSGRLSWRRDDEVDAHQRRAIMPCAGTDPNARNALRSFQLSFAVSCRLRRTIGRLIFTSPYPTLGFYTTLLLASVFQPFASDEDSTEQDSSYFLGRRCVPGSINECELRFRRQFRNAEAVSITIAWRLMT